MEGLERVAPRFTHERSKEWEEAERRIQAAKNPVKNESPVDHRSLYERLQANRLIKEEEYQESWKLSSLIRTLDDEEIDFLDKLRKEKIKVEEEAKKSVKEGLEVFRKARVQFDQSLQQSIYFPRVSASISKSLEPSERPLKRMKESVLKGVILKKNKDVFSKKTHSKYQSSKNDTNSAVHLFHKSSSSPQKDREGYKDPIRVFIDTFKLELRKSKEFQESVKALQDKSGKLGESEAYKRAREVYRIAKGGADVAGNFSNQTLKKVGKIIKKSVITTWESTPIKLIRKGTVVTSKFISSITYPIRENRIYKLVTGSVKQAIYDGDSSYYGGYVDKKTRRQVRKAQNRKNHEFPLKTSVKEDLNTDVKIIIYKESTWKASWRQFKNNSWIFNRINYWRQLYNYSENPIIETVKDVVTSMGNFRRKLFMENEAARVSRLFKDIDPSFRIESFLQELREYILPEVVEAYVKGDNETLKLWLSEASYQIWFTMAKEYISQGLISDGKVLDIRGVDVVSYRILSPNSIPCLVISFKAQEIHLYRNAKSKELIAGNENFIQEVTYAAAFTRIPDEVTNSETRGWKILDFARIRDIL
ncbi:hypothetical protein PCANB_000802 [Pneumocystis canis]|nr:hypothetical protein PCANB_000802 [Pneumocystis canis]